MRNRRDACTHASGTDSQSGCRQYRTRSLARPYDKELIPDWGIRGEGGAGWPRLRRLSGNPAFNGGLSSETFYIFLGSKVLYATFCSLGVADAVGELLSLGQVVGVLDNFKTTTDIFATVYCGFSR